MLTTLLAVSFCSASSAQEDYGQDSRPGLVAWWVENLRWELDASLRFAADDDGEVGAVSVLGLDVHKVVSTTSRDVATLVLQPYLLRLDGSIQAPGIFEDDHDYALQWRIFNGNLHLSDDRSLSLRAGHFELPFGLEQNVDTNGTLKQYTHASNFGLKTDWGVTLNGELETFDYEIAWSRGSGNEYLDRGGDGVVSGRIGTPREGNRIFGASFATGDFLTVGGPVDRRRVAVDAQYFVGPVTASVELAAGEDSGEIDVLRGVGELQWQNPYETKAAWAQLFATESEAAGQDLHGLQLRLGGRWTIDRGASVSAQFVQTLDPLQPGASRDTSLTVQLRYRF